MPKFNPKQSKNNINKTFKSSVTKLFIYKHKEQDLNVKSVHAADPQSLYTWCKEQQSPGEGLQRTAHKRQKSTHTEGVFIGLKVKVHRVFSTSQTSLRIESCNLSLQLVIRLYTRENKDYEQIQVAFLLAMNKENTVTLIIHASQISSKTND